MNIQSRPLLISAGIGAAVLLVISLSNTLISNFLAPALVATPTPDGNLPTQVLTASTLLCCALLFVNFFVYAGTGILYIYLYARQAIPSAEAGAIGGALSALLASVVSGVIGLVLSAIIDSITAGSAVESLGGLPPELAPAVGLTSTVTAIFSSVGLCFAAVIAMLIGAIGGAIGGAVLSSRQRV